MVKDLISSRFLNQRHRLNPVIRSKFLMLPDYKKQTMNNFKRQQPDPAAKMFCGPELSINSEATQ